MKNTLKTFNPFFKFILLIFVIYYLKNNINLVFFEKVYEYYFVIFILIPILFFKILINSLKISYLLKILKKKKIDLKKIFKVLLTAQLSTAFPVSFLTSKAWIDSNLIKYFKLNFREYLKFNFLIFIFTFLMFIILYLFRNNSEFLIFFYIIFISFFFLIKKYRNYSVYFSFFIFNLLINISISFIIIFYVDSSILSGNIFNILFSTVISNYLNLFSFLPFNIGYSQVVYSLTFNLFSLPNEIALIIATVKQITQIFMVSIIFIFTVKN